MSTSSTTATHVEKGAGLARGPALIEGIVLVAFGLIALLRNNEFPSFSANFPDGNAQGTDLFGLFEVNGWTSWLIIACGALLLVGAAQHLLAKTMSLVVGIVLGAAAVIALVTGQVLGVGAANLLTIIAMGAAAVVLLLNIFAPRVEHEVPVADAPPVAPQRTTAGA